MDKILAVDKDIEKARIRLQNIISKNLDKYENVTIGSAVFLPKKKTILNIRCNCGFKFTAGLFPPKNMKKIGCPICNQRTLRAEDIEPMVKFLGYTLLKQFRKGENNRTLEVSCSNSHVFITDINRIKIHKCVECFPPKNAEKTVEWINDLCVAKGYKFLGQFLDGKGRKCINVICSNGHDWSPNLSNFMKEGSGCPSCKKKPLPDEVYLYLQDVRDNTNQYLKYGITRNDPYCRMEKQQKSSGMDHDLICCILIDYVIAVKAEQWLKNNIDYLRLGKKFDGFTETVDYRYLEFLKYYVSNAFMMDWMDVEVYANYIYSIAET